MHFGATLRLLRTDAGYSLRGLAECVGVSGAYLSRVENGHDAAPAPDRLVAIARALGLPTTMLVELAERVGPFTTGYLKDVPDARALLVDIARRKLSAAEIARVRDFIDKEFPDTGERVGRATDIASLLSEDRVILGLSCADLDDAIDIAATRLDKAAGWKGAHALADAIRAREAESSSLLGGGVAVPHAIKPRAVAAAALVTLARPLAGKTPDGVPLRLIFVHVHASGGAVHLRQLVQLANIANPATLDSLCEAPDARTLIKRLAAATS